MHTKLSAFIFASLSIAVLSFAGCAGTSSMRTGEAVAADIEAVEFPQFDGARRDDAAYIEEFMEADRAARERWSTLVRELMDVDIHHEAAPQHISRRWQPMLRSDDGLETIRKETEEVLARDPSPELATTAVFFQAQVEGRLASQGRDADRALAAAERFIALAPEDERGARLLTTVAELHESGSPQQIATYQRIINDYEGTRTATSTKGKLRQATSVGKPFELAFTCAVTNSEVDMEMLRGKVVLIDFWATWCGPCVAEMPKLKALYEKHREDGFEIIGISLDQPQEQGGLERLLAFVEENEIAWPQYYQGNGWDSEFSTSWGINGIPTLFLIDRAGNLRTVKARTNLEEQVESLLAEGRERAAAQ